MFARQCGKTFTSTLELALDCVRAEAAGVRTLLKRLKDAGVGLRRFYSRVRGLEPKLGSVLWQLPARFKTPELERLDRFPMPRTPKIAAEHYLGRAEKAEV